MNSSQNSILIIDDDEIDNFTNKHFFESIGLKNVVCIQKAQESIVYIYNSNILPNNIFIDINMSMINGFDIIRKLKKINISFEKTKFFFLSDSVDPEDKVKASAMNVSIINKPLTIEKIKTTLLYNKKNKYEN